MKEFSVLLAVLSVFRIAAPSPVVGPEPIRCSPCSPEQLAACPAVSQDCPEVLRDPGCGCCSSCALRTGDSCGVYTASCAAGLRCLPRPDEPRPLHALTRGHGLCTQHPQAGEDEMMSEQLALRHLLGLHSQGAAEAQESIKDKVNAIRKKLVQQGPCHTELSASLDAITESQHTLGEKFTSFYLPNCDKHGFYKAKQCDTSLMGAPGRCWCVSSWSGRRVPSDGDPAGDVQCDQELTH